MGSRSARIWISAYRRYDAGARSVTTSPSSQQGFPKSQFGGWHDTGVFHSLHPAGRKGFGIVLHFEIKNHPEIDAKPITSHLNTKKSRNKSTYWDPKNLPPTPAPAMWCFFPWPTPHHLEGIGGVVAPLKILDPSLNPGHAGWKPSYGRFFHQFYHQKTVFNHQQLEIHQRQLVIWLTKTTKLFPKNWKKN